MPSIHKPTLYALCCLIVFGGGFIHSVQAGPIPKKEEKKPATTTPKTDKKQKSSPRKAAVASKEKEQEEEKKKKAPVPQTKEKETDTTKKNEKPESAPPAKEESEDDLPKLKKPPVLEGAKMSYKSSDELLTPLIIHQKKTYKEYVPFLRSIDFSVNYSGMLLELIGYGIRSSKAKKSQKSHLNQRYRGGIGVLLRKNIYLTSSIGYVSVKPYLIKRLIREEFYKSFNEALRKDDKSGVNHREAVAQNLYRVKGVQSAFGANYLLQGNRVDLSIGAQYTASFFKAYVKGKQAQKMKASWLSFLFSGERRIFRNWNWYLGSTVGMKVLTTHSEIKHLGLTKRDQADENYHVPGYGRSVSTALPVFGLYLKYKVILSKKYIGT